MVKQGSRESSRSVQYYLRLQEDYTHSKSFRVLGRRCVIVYLDTSVFARLTWNARFSSCYLYRTVRYIAVDLG